MSGVSRTGRASPLPQISTNDKCIDVLFDIADILRDLNKSSGKELLDRVSLIERIESDEQTSIPLYFATGSILAALKGHILSLNPDVMSNRCEAYREYWKENKQEFLEDLEYFRQLARDSANAASRSAQKQKL